MRHTKSRDHSRIRKARTSYIVNVNRTWQFLQEEVTNRSVLNSLQAFSETKVTRSSHGKSILIDIQEQWQRDQRQKK